MDTRPSFDGHLDPITFEILRHRLWAINDEQGLIAATISGSPVVYEANDFNSALLTPEGDLLFVGVFVAFHAACLDLAVKNIIARFSADPGIHDGDMFITNDPWAGAIHMNDILMVSPVFYEGEIIMWTAIVSHELDVGGPTPGGFGVGGKDVFSEGPVFPPLKLVEAGRLRRDVEALFLRNTRTPGPTALDIRARVGSQNITRERVRDLARRYGKDSVRAAQRQIKEHVRRSIQERLRELPDGTWYEQAYLDHDGNDNIFYHLQLSMTKKGDKLVFDYRGSSKQAPGSINCTQSGLQGGVLTAVLPMLCYDVPWCTGGLQGVIDVLAEEGSLIDARHPAGVSSGATGAAWIVGTLASAAIAKMYACSDKYKEEVQGCWYPGYSVTTISGIDQYGRPMAAPMMDGGAGGGGARSFRDGIDTSGSRSAISAALPNVETNEQKLPILQVYRKQRQDACGPGKYRGGVGLEYMMIPHESPTAISTVNSAHGVSLPGGPGIYGGLPPSVQRNVILRNSNVRELFAAGKIPTQPHDLEYAGKDILAAKDRSLLSQTDAYVALLAGGGGYGDPLTREPALVERDVRNNLCSAEIARQVYGVSLSPDGRLNLARTKALRDELRAQRLKESRPVGEKGLGAGDWGLEADPSQSLSPDTRHPTSSLRSPAPSPRRVMPIGEHLEVVEHAGERVIVCVECGHRFGPANQDPKTGSVTRAAAITEASPVNRYGMTEEVVINQFFCPGCGTMIATNVQRRDDPLYLDTKLEL